MRSHSSKLIESKTHYNGFQSYKNFLLAHRKLPYKYLQVIYSYFYVNIFILILSNTSENIF